MKFGVLLHQRHKGAKEAWEIDSLGWGLLPGLSSEQKNSRDETGVRNREKRYRSIRSGFCHSEIGGDSYTQSKEIIRNTVKLSVQVSQKMRNHKTLRG
jgi:hypothetical protein